MKARSVSRGAKQPTGCLVLFFAIFMAVGSIFTWFFFAIPASAWWKARSWQEVPCTVVESRVGANSDSDGSTYRVEVTFDYLFDGAQYRSSRYNFHDNFYSGGYDGKAEVVARYPPGTQATCWANPANPAEAVFRRDFSPAYLIGLFPLVFVAFGAGGMVWAIGQGRRSRRSATAAGDATGPRESPFGVEIQPDARQPRVLKPQMSPLGKLIGITLIALFWNGIVSVFLVVCYKGWRSGDGDGCLTLFLVPFVLIGGALIYGIFQQFLVLFNPRLQLTLSSAVLVPGESASLQWTIAGKAERIQKLKIVLEGREEATYRQGTDTKTDRNIFATVPVVETGHQMLIANGSARVDIPADTMPSFEATHNKIVWSLKATCEIPGWPDSDDEYEIVVAPAASR